MSTMKIGGYDAVVRYDPEIEMFRGEFIGLNGGADFYASDVEGLKREAEISLQVFLETCEQKGIDPVKNYSGKFNVRINPELHRDLVVVAEDENISLNSLVGSMLSITMKAAQSSKSTINDIEQLMQYVAEDGLEKYMAIHHVAKGSHRAAAARKKVATKKKAAAKRKAAVKKAPAKRKAKASPRHLATA